MLTFLAVILSVLIVRISLLLSLGFFQFQYNKVNFKQAPGLNHENTIFQQGNSKVIRLAALYVTNLVAFTNQETFALY